MILDDSATLQDARSRAFLVCDAEGHIVTADRFARIVFALCPAPEGSRLCCTVPLVAEDLTAWPDAMHPMRPVVDRANPQAPITLGVVQPDGTHRWIEGRPVHLDGPGHPGAPAWVIELTAKPAAESPSVDLSARGHQRLLETSMQHTGDAVAIVAATEALLLTAPVVYVNEAFSRTTGYASDKAIGHTLRVLCGARTDTLRLEQARRDVKVGQPIVEEVVLYHADGAAYWAEVQVALVPAEAESQAHLIVIHRDVTVRKAYEVGLIQAKEEAEAMSRLRSNFLAIMSHEIRTPLTAVIGFSEILREEVDGEPQEFADLVYHGSKRLMETLASVMDLAQLESGTYEMNLAQMDIRQVVQEVVRMMEPEAVQRGLLLRTTVPDHPLVATANEHALFRVLTNLVTNALKFTEDGQIEVVLEDEDQHVVLHVKDTGIGIGSAFLPRLFDEFAQESEGQARRFGGVGLGLSITKKLVTLMQGTLRVESEKGVGSTFTVALERTPLDAPEPSQDKAVAHLDEPAILYVDGEAEARLVVPVLLAAVAPVDTVERPDEAMAAVEATAYSLVLLSVDTAATEAVDRVALVRGLRDRSARRDVPVVAVAPRALPGDDARLLQEGFDGYVAKPFTGRQLTHVVERHRASG
ncbi:MAG: ATP-binding protein [Bacteroidota bacterium]